MAEEEAEDYMFKFVGIAIGIGILAENLLLLITVAINRKLHTTTFTLIANLAVADMLAGLMCIFMYAGGFQFDVQHKTIWFLKYGGTVLTLTASACGLLAIAVDRHIKITSLTVPSRGSSKRARRCVFSIILSWVFALGLSIPPVLGWNCLQDELCSGNYNGLSRNYLRLVSATGSCILVATFVMYALIYRAVRASTRRVTRQMGSAPLDVHIQRQARLQNTLTLVLGVFTACWLPFIILTIVDSVCSSCALDDPFDLIIPIIALLNSAVNPLIYALRSKDVRSTYVYILCCCRTQPSQCCNSPPAFVGKARDNTDGHANPQTLFTGASSDVTTGDDAANNPQLLNFRLQSDEEKEEPTSQQ